ncbi:cytochrome-c oxidase, cbb3-type subunit III [Marinicaulis aureus]|uniref:Cbb3-type cytochrome c oxidase subunit n=1 Tax=Hyphococcus aureus TaxID=2666033 RepID=A0ABW1KWR6_9PROT
MSDKEIDETTGVETTGHSWDDIRELNNPLPRWWLIVWYISIVWAIGYWVVMPSWPGITGYLKGTRNHSERANVEVAVAELDAQRADATRRLLTAPNMEAIENDPDLQAFALAAGESLFGDNCATCHGAGGQGFKGYPNLNDDDWLWGGKLEDIRQTIRYGIRSDHAQAHLSLMQAYGAGGLLPRETVDDLVHYVRSLSGQEHDEAAAMRAAPVFQVQCVQCHGAEGKGDQSQGAPNLTDPIWLYGGDAMTIRETLWNGRGGVMPTWEGRLSEEEILALAVYVHSLGGGE